MARRVIALLLILPLGACGLFVSKETRALRKSPDYRAGYSDGCNSAYDPGADKSRDTNVVRDDAMYRTNRAYQAGWRTGLNACRSSGNTSYAGVPDNAGPIRDRNPGNGGYVPGSP